MMILKWTKHGETCIYLPSHPFVDITIYMDIDVNPGPSKIKLEKRQTSNISKAIFLLSHDVTSILSVQMVVKGK